MSLATRMSYRERCHIPEYLRGSSCLGARTSKRAPVTTAAVGLVMTKRRCGLVVYVRSTLRDAITVNELLTREVHWKHAHVHARLYSRRPRSRRAN